MQICRVSAQVIDLVNETVVMDYIDTPAGAVSYQGRGAAWLLSYAATFSPPRKVRLGVAVRQPGAPKTWWQADNITALDWLLNGVVPLAARYRSWNGLAVFHTALWRESVRRSLRVLFGKRQQHGRWLILSFSSQC